MTFGVDANIHKTAIIEDGVFIGDRTSVWDSVHIRQNARIGSDCIIGEKTYIAYDVQIGNRVKINSFAYICTGVTIEDGVMVSAGTVFTNDKYPRATSTDLGTPHTSDPDDETLETIIHQGATIGARCVIGGGIEIGRFAMIGMGAVVTRSVPDFGLVYGNPSKLNGFVCRCGRPLISVTEVVPGQKTRVSCTACGLPYVLVDDSLREAPIHD